MTKKSMGIAAAILGMLQLPLNAEAQSTIRVPADQPTIQDAINTAINGDKVLVAPGNYVENINFLGKAITVTSEGGSEVTVIDGNQADSVATFTSGEGTSSVLDGFTLQNGRSGFDTPGFGDGGGIRIENSSPTVTRNKIINNRACTGAGIAISFGSPIVQGNTISNNVQAGCSGGIGGGGISIGGSSSAQILDNVISDNFMGSADGGGISLFAAGTPAIKGNIIRGNNATGLSPCAQGGGISLVNVSDALIVQNLITGNEAGCGGGISWLVPSGARGPLLVNNTIADNISQQGSGIFADGFDAKTTLINNLVIGSAGQTAIFCGNFNDTNPPIFKFNDVFSPSGSAYGGICTDQTAINGNISAGPLFVDSANGNYHLQPGSPSIEVGDNTAPNLPATDFDGDPRILDGDGNSQAVIDMGVDEFTGSVPPITVAIDIKPGSFPNRINLKSKKALSVALLTKDGFDATAANPYTVRFGRTGTEAAPLGLVFEDVEGDGDTDIIFHFSIQATGIVCGDTSAFLTGETNSGQAIKGSDSINAVVCN